MADHLYIAIERLNLGAANWVLLVTAINELSIIGGANQYELQDRGNTDTFVYEDETYSNAYTWEARFAFGQITIDNIKNKLAAIFEKDPADIGHSANKLTFRERPTAILTFTYGGQNLIRLAIFGCDSEDDLCTWNESRIEHNGYITDNAEEWGEVVTL